MSLAPMTGQWTTQAFFLWKENALLPIAFFHESRAGPGQNLDALGSQDMGLNEDGHHAIWKQNNIASLHW